MEEAAARALLAEHRPDLSSRPAELNDDGWEFLVLAFDDVVARFPRTPQARWKLGIEIGLLSIVADALPVSVPVHHHVARDQQGAPLFTVDERIPGTALTGDVVDAVDLSRTALDLGAALSRLHAIPVEHGVAAGMAPFSARVLNDVYRSFARRLTDGPAVARSPVVARRIAQAVDSFTTRDDLVGVTPAIIHGDLGEQIFVEQPSGRVTGIIDWADAVIGDPALDVGAILEYGEDFVGAVLDAYVGSGDSTLLERARFYHSVSAASGFLGAIELGYETEADICWDEMVKRWD